MEPKDVGDEKKRLSNCDEGINQMSKYAEYLRESLASSNADAAEVQFLIYMRHLCNYADINFKKEIVDKHFRSKLASHSPPHKDLMPMISKGIFTMVKDVKEMHSDLGNKLSSVKNELSNLIKIEAKDVTRI